MNFIDIVVVSPTHRSFPLYTPTNRRRRRRPWASVESNPTLELFPNVLSYTHLPPPSPPPKQ